MTPGESFGRRPAWIRHALAAALILLCAIDGHGMRCDDILGGLSVLLCVAVQLGSAAVSLTRAALAWRRFDRRNAGAELRLGLAMSLMVVPAIAAFFTFMPEGCK